MYRRTLFTIILPALSALTGVVEGNSWGNSLGNSWGSVSLPRNSTPGCPFGAQEQTLQSLREEPVNSTPKTS
jgi:hypothetical protein